MEREMVKCVGRKEIVGRPMMFGTTDEFLKVFSLSHVKDLPPLESFQPSRDTMSDAQAKISEGQDQVDIEDIIAKGVNESETESLSSESPEVFQRHNDDIDKNT
jgi:segregation and condensation protein B